MTGAMAGSPEGVSHAGGLGELLELLGHRVDEGHGEALHQHSERREKSTVSEADAEIEKDRASHHPSQSHVLCCAAPPLHVCVCACVRVCWRPPMTNHTSGLRPSCNDHISAVAHPRSL